jgi:uncharacterized protein affecting Mg2+/Co2+ transport
MHGCGWQGIRVTASSVFYDDHFTRTYCYRIKMELVDADALGAYPSAQLLTRCWLVYFETGMTEQIDGNAVVGHYPLLSGTRPDPPAALSVLEATLPCV